MLALTTLAEVKAHPYIASGIAIVIIILIILIIKYVTSSSTSATFRTSKNPGNPKVKSYKYTENNLESLISTDPAAQADWDPAAIGVDKSVHESHKAYADEAYVSDYSNNSTQSIRDDDQSIVPWVGLRRPDYKDVTADKNSWQTSSTYGDQLYNSTSHRVINW